MINRIKDLLPHATRSAHAPAGPGAADPQGPEWKKIMKQVEEFVGRNPGTCLISAFGLGVAVAWLMKRK